MNSATENKPTKKEIDQATESLLIARIGVLMKQQFWGTMVSRLFLEHTDDIPTCATNGRKIFYNATFVNTKTVDELKFICAHEILHVMLDHIGRTGDRDHRLTNIAQDYAINDILVTESVGKMPEMALYDKKYHEWGWEQIYEDLLENAEKINIDDLVQRLIDQHMNGEGEDGKGKGLSQEELDVLRDEIREAMISAAQQVGIGNTPAGIRRLLKDLIEPKMNWKELLQQQIESQIRGDYTFMKPSRRSWHLDAILPAQNVEKAVDVTIAIDTSGSISHEQVREFFSEIKGIVESFQSYKINVCCWDTAMYNFQTFTEDNGDDIFDYEIMGGGGTDPNCVYEYLKENDIVPRQMCFFTDGFLNWQSCGDPDYVDNVLWLINGNNKVNAPFGDVVYYEKV